MRRFQLAYTPKGKGTDPRSIRVVVHSRGEPDLMAMHRRAREVANEAKVDISGWNQDNLEGFRIPVYDENTGEDGAFLETEKNGKLNRWRMGTNGRIHKYDD